MSFTSIVLWPVLIASLGIPKIPPAPLVSDDAVGGTLSVDPQSAETLPEGRVKETKTVKPPDRFRWDELANALLPLEHRSER